MSTYYRMPETEFRAWFANFVTVAVDPANLATLGMTAGSVTAFNDAQTAYAAAVTALAPAHDAARAATNTKNNAYNAAFAIVQTWANQWQADPDVPDALKLSLGLNLRDTNPHPRPVFAISELSGTGNSTGVVRLKWNRNGNLSGCSFIVQTRPVGGEWSFLTVTSKTRIAIGGQALVPTEYRVIVERRGTLSSPSDAVVVYGSGGEMELHLLEEVA